MPRTSRSAKLLWPPIEVFELREVDACKGSSDSEQSTSSSSASTDAFVVPSSSENVEVLRVRGALEAFAIGNYVTVREDEVGLDMMKGMQGKIVEIDDEGKYTYICIYLFFFIYFFWGGSFSLG